MVAKYCPHQHHFYRELGSSLKRYRKASSLSMEDLAIATDVSRSTILSLERGNVKISVYLLMKLMQRICMPAGDLDDIFLVADLRATKRKKDIDAARPAEQP